MNMGRKTKNKDEKKIKISITIDNDVFEKLEQFNINKSKLINWLLLNKLKESVYE